MNKKILLFISTILSISVPVFGENENIQVGSTTRNMITYAPTGLPESPALLISLHGMNQDAAYQQNQCQWEAVADTAKFVVVYPNGIGKSWDLSGTSDITFIETIIDLMNERYNIDRNRVYLSGFSMGAMMTYYTASKIADKIAALAPVSGYMMDGSANSVCAIPLIHTHGTADDVCVYSTAPGYVEKWVKINGCDPTPQVFDPYPANKPNGGCSLKLWTNETTGVEVALLTLGGKGHWHSMDQNGAMTSCEIWNFVKKFNRGPAAPAPPKLISASPETGWFDLPDSALTLTYSFSEAVDPGKITATLSGPSGSFKLTALESDFDSTLTFTVGTKLKMGEYNFTILNMYGENGGCLKKRSYDFIVGHEEYVENFVPQIIFKPNWMLEKETIGEGVPKGWKRINSRADGTKNEVGENQPNTGGVRMKYFNTGGNFDAGFYVSARDYDLGTIYYGTYTDSRLHLTPGTYSLSFNSIYWTGECTFTASVTDLNAKQIFQKSGLASSGNLNETSDTIVKGSLSHNLSFIVPVEGDYILSFSTSGGWAGVVIGNICLSTSKSKSQTVKEPFYEALSAFNAIYEELQSEKFDEIVTFRNSATAKYEYYNSFSSYSSSDYENAITDMESEGKRLVTRMGYITSFYEALDSAESVLKIYENIPAASSLRAYTSLASYVEKGKAIDKDKDLSFVTLTSKLWTSINFFLKKTSDVETIEDTSTILSVECYDLSGHIQTGRLKRGVYIEKTSFNNGLIKTTKKIITE